MAAAKLATLQPPAFQLSLRIKHPSIDPADISKELGIEPEHSFRAGQPRHSKSRVAPAAVHNESYWLAALNPTMWFENPSYAEPLNLSVTQKHIDAAVARNLTWALSLCVVRLSKLPGSPLHKIRSDGGEISLLVTLSPTAVSSFTLTPEVSRMFGEMGITLEFEIAFSF
jgi:hypothetical protein